MKNNKKILGFVALATIIIFLVLACSDSSDDGIEYGPTNYGGTMSFSGEQVWIPKESTRISESLVKFTENRIINPIFILYDFNLPPPYIKSFESVGSGNIVNGILNFTVEEPDVLKLNDSETLFWAFFNVWYGLKAIDIDDKNTKVNNLMIITSEGAIPSEGIVRENLSGTKTSLTGEYVWYLYVDRDCTITASKALYNDSVYIHTYNAFNISLKKGWNTICKSETYNTGGNPTYSIQLKNPYHQWVIQEF
ncbi:MAG: hypothetical protein FWE72_03250 [Spirochaetaceae bacterium]|nr:hypothetical protein [Spirochaetaceae bacterium]